MDDNKILYNIITDLHLGSLITEPKRVSGGYMHKMYCLETTKGKHAVKLLNQAVMKRPDVFKNYQRAERLERVLQENQIPIVPAVELNDRKMQCIGDQYFYLFPWIDGKVLDWNDINKEHCSTAGQLLAKIHNIEQIDAPSAIDEINIDWDAYIAKAKSEGSEIAGRLADCREVLYTGQNEYNKALKKVPSITCICNGDMDSKNVMWEDGNPYIIDLECLDYGNPYWDMFQLALSWSGNVTCNIDYELLEAFIKSYYQTYKNNKVDCTTFYGGGFGWLWWLEYNVKRALMIECTDEEERKMGISEVYGTIHRITYYHSIKEEMLQHLSAMND